MKVSFSRHIEDLYMGLERTQSVEDRPRYVALLAHAAIVLAKLTLDAPKSDLFAAIDTYERLWGNTWLEGWSPVYPDSYDKFKSEVGYPTT